MDIYTTGPQGSHQQATGTSFAAPQVAVTAALLRARYPRENATQIINRLTSTAHRAGRGRSAQWGYGIIDPYRALTAPAGPTTIEDPLRQPVTATDQPHPGHRGNPAWMWTAAGAGIAVVTALATFALRRWRRQTRSDH